MVTDKLVAEGLVYDGADRQPPSPASAREFLRRKVRTAGRASPCPARFGMHPGFAAGFCQFADAHDVALPLGHRDYAAGVEQVEDVAGLDALVVGRQRHQVLLAVATALPPFLEI